MKDFCVFFSTGLPAKVLYSSLLVTAIAFVIGLLCKGIKLKKQYLLWVLLIEYVFIVICSTIICRGAMSFEFARLELEPFWTYKAVIAHTPSVSVWDIILNVVLFLPLGFFVRLLYPNINILKMTLIALACSVCIELNQYYYEKGIAQTDDVMHNVIGAICGYGIAWVFTKVCSTLS